MFGTGPACTNGFAATRDRHRYTNLLIYAHRAGLAEHRAARQALERAANDDAGWGVAVAAVAEFWSVVTHPAAAGRPSTPREATAFIGSLLRQGHARLWHPGSGFGERLIGLAAERNLRGVRIFDLQIALTAVDNGAREIWTHDRDFVSLRI